MNGHSVTGLARDWATNRHSSFPNWLTRELGIGQALIPQLHLRLD